MDQKKPYQPPADLWRGQLAEWRERMGFSQGDAWEALDCSPADWSRWESGEAKAPRYVGLSMAALALGIEVN